MKYLCLPVSLFFMMILASCSADNYPPIVDVPTYNYRYGQFVWHELGTSNVDASREFYGQLFNWEFESIPTTDGNYTLIRQGNKYLGGMIETKSQQNLWIGAISVEDTEKALDFLSSMGASTVIGTTRITGRGSMALLKDPQGAAVSIIHSSAGDPPLLEADANEWLWMELWSDQPESSAEFYGKTLGYDITEQVANGKPYWIFGKQELKIAGISPNPISNMTTQWVPYIKVTDPEETVNRAKSLGATILMAPNQAIRNGSVAVLTDPNGAIFCIQKWPFN
ncbi:VOC family protein [Fulvivirga sedimenti]|uniref:VOC family protein n=1 Tax=Fulvivirga sedimenti TaxID=2879465 RepID=A0A9X1KWJ9_9BACT|nr:VOC family protein [Fulvivirga sedimenti]MCA6074786.1 VOC family protein [Fulvivirga sedimenti]MCA6075963.1 VOC family protein [Fulvivirga sedimenti]MCA6077091.1 VOC family protein [Fulvivirga sedimenti]